MNILYENIRSLLQIADIEGLIALGTPPDEYDSEAETIYEELKNLDQIDGQKIVEIISAVWMRYFNLSQEDINKRTPEIQDVARRIMISSETPASNSQQ